MNEEKCSGLAGRLFGHKFRPRYNTSSEPTMLASWGTGFKAQLVMPIDLNELARDLSIKTQTYAGDICERCGLCTEVDD